MKIVTMTSLTAIFVIGLAVFFAGCVDDERQKDIEESIPPESTMGEESTLPDPAQGDESVTEPEPVTGAEPVADLNLKLGRAAKTSKISVKVTSAPKTYHYDYYSDTLKQTTTEEASPGRIFVIANVLIEKIEGEGIYAGSSKFSMTDSTGVRYYPKPYHGDDKLVELEETHLNQRMRGSVLFEVPEDAEELKIWYDFKSLSAELKSVSWDV